MSSSVVSSVAAIRRWFAEVVAVRVEARDGYAGEHAVLLLHGRGHVLGRTIESSQEFIEERTVGNADALDRVNALCRPDGSLVVQAGEASQTGLAEEREMDGKGKRTQPAVGTDVAGGTAASDVLLARGERSTRMSVRPRCPPFHRRAAPACSARTCPG